MKKILKISLISLVVFTFVFIFSNIGLALLKKRMRLVKVSRDLWIVPLFFLLNLNISFVLQTRYITRENNIFAALGGIYFGKC